jgi:hypothetical protein
MDNVLITNQVTPSISDSFDAIVKGSRELLRDYSSLLNLKLSAGLVDSQIEPKVRMLLLKHHELFAMAADFADLFVVSDGTGTFDIEEMIPVSVSGVDQTITAVAIHTSSGWSAADFWFNPSYHTAPTSFSDALDDASFAETSTYGLHILTYDETEEEWKYFVGSDDNSGDASSGFEWRARVFPRFLNSTITVSGQSLDISANFPAVSNLCDLIAEIKGSLESVIS